MSKSNLKMVGNFGCYLDDDNVISFQIGDRPMASVLEPDPMFPPEWRKSSGYAVAEHPRIPGVQPWLQQHEMRGSRVRHKEEPASAKTDYQAGQHAVWPWACRVQAGNRGRETSETVG